MKILTVVGARPQFVKAAVVSSAIQKAPSLDEVLVHTGQHFDDNMSNVFFEELNIPHPKYNLGIGGGSHASNTGKAMQGIEDLILEEAPDLVLVYGDTDSTLAGSLAAAKLCVDVAHIESGLRSFNRAMPEEINRILTDHVAALLFTPSASANGQLAAEGIGSDKVHFVGDVMYDAILKFNPIAESRSCILNQLALVSGEFALCTLHRKENVDQRDRLASIVAGIGDAGLETILPLHPRTRKMLEELDIAMPSNIRLVDPVGYFDMITLQRHAKVIGTDSGGIQKEAYFQGVPCVTFRDETEWTELVDIGVNTITGADCARIAEAMAHAPAIGERQEVYGKGDAATLIADILSRYPIDA
jgi:UDP-GlcNAc3NAcA epimerase